MAEFQASFLGICYSIPFQSLSYFFWVKFQYFYHFWFLYGFPSLFFRFTKVGFLVVMCLADWFFHSQHLWPWILLLRVPIFSLIFLCFIFVFFCCFVSIYSGF